MRKYKKILLLKFLLILKIAHFIFAYNVKIELQTKLLLKDGKEPLGRPGDIEVYKKNIWITDRAFANIKIYNKKGELVKILGRKGSGPGEFLSPNYIEIDKNKIFVQDMGHLKYVILDNEFNEIKRFFFLMSAQPFVVYKTKLINYEYYRDEKGKEFDGVIIDISQRTPKIIKKLMPIKYPKSDAWNRIISMIGYLDISKKRKEIYFVKQNKIKIYKFDIEGNFIKSFGKNPSYFIPCKRTKDFDIYLKWGRAPKGIEAARRWRKSFSWVCGIFVLEKFLGVVIKNYNNKIKKWEYYCEFYDFEGNFLDGERKLKEVGALFSPERFLIDSNNKDRVYILEIDEDKEPPEYRFLEYKIM